MQEQYEAATKEGYLCRFTVHMDRMINRETKQGESQISQGGQKGGRRIHDVVFLTEQEGENVMVKKKKLERGVVVKNEKRILRGNRKRNEIVGRMKKW